MRGSRHKREEGWAAPIARAARRTWLAPLVAAAVLAAGGWLGADAWLTHRARHLAADRWAELRMCLLGEGLASGQRLSERMRLVALGGNERGAPWPERCLAYAAALDAALAATSVRHLVGEVPSATALVRELDGARLDLLAATLERSDLPAGRVNHDVPLPRPLSIALRRSELDPWTKAGVDAVTTSADPRDGKAIRVLVNGRDERLLCTLPATKNASHAECRPLSATQASMRLARAEQGAALLVYRGEEDGADAWLDATTGQRVWRPRDAASLALVRDSGLTTVLHAEHYQEGGIKEHRVVQLRPGKPPTSKRLALPREARTLLLRDATLGWFFDHDGDVLAVQALGDGERWLAPRQLVGRLPARSSYVADCTSTSLQAVLFASGRRHTLFLREARQGNRVLAIGMLEGEVRLSCHGDAAVVLAHHHELLRRLRCTPDGCAAVEVTSPLFRAALSLATTGGKVALLWRHPGEPLRLRTSAAEQLAQATDALLVDDGAHRGVDVRRARLLAHGSTTLAFVESQQDELFVLRLSESGDVKPVRASR